MTARPASVDDARRPHPPGATPPRAPASRPLGAWLILLACVVQFVVFAFAIVADWRRLSEAAGAHAVSTLRLFGAFLPATLLLAAGLCFVAARRTAVALFALYLAWGLWWLGTLVPGVQDALRLALAAVGAAYGLLLLREDARRAAAP